MPTIIVDQIGVTESTSQASSGGTANPHLLRLIKHAGITTAVILQVIILGLQILNSLAKTSEKVFGVSFNEILYDLGIRADKHSFMDILKLSGAKYDKASLSGAFREKSSFGNMQTLGSVPTDYRFLIPEIFLAMSMTAYEETAKWAAWVGGTDTVNQLNGIKVPRLMRGQSMPYEIAEGQSIPAGSVEFGQKQVSVRKYGLHFGITDEMMTSQSLDTVAFFMRNYMSDMNIGENAKALQTLINGEQTDGSESSPVIGVDATADGFKQLDIDRVSAQLKGLNMQLNGGIGSITNALQDLNQSLPNRERLTLQQYAGVMTDLYNLPDADQILLFDKSKAMRRLSYGAMKIETERDPSRQIERIYLTFHSGFYIAKRDARVIVDKSVTFAANPFPAYMDFEARRLETFGSGF